MRESPVAPLAGLLLLVAARAAVSLSPFCLCSDCVRVKADKPFKMPETVLHIRVLVVLEEGLRWKPPHYGGNCENGIGMAFTFMAPVPNLQNPLRVVREKQQVQCLVLRNLAILGTQNSPFGRAEYGW